MIMVGVVLVVLLLLLVYAVSAAMWLLTYWDTPIPWYAKCYTLPFRVIFKALTRFIP